MPRQVRSPYDDSKTWLDQAREDAVAAQVTVLRATATLTDAQIKGLPTTAIEVVPAIENAIIYPLFAHARMEWVADYAGIHAQSRFSIRIGGNSESLWSLKQEIGSSVSGLLAGSGPDGTHALFQPRISSASEYTSGAFSSLSGFYDSDIVNQPIFVDMDNTGGDLTGGDADNLLSVRVFYTVIQI